LSFGFIWDDFHKYKLQPTQGFPSPSHGSSPLLPKLCFSGKLLIVIHDCAHKWKAPIIFAVSVIAKMFLAVAVTSGPIPIVDCKTENWVWLQCKFTQLILFYSLKVRSFRYPCTLAGLQPLPDFIWSLFKIDMPLLDKLYYFLCLKLKILKIEAGTLASFVKNFFRINSQKQRVAYYRWRCCSLEKCF
jgi:hypothetical protein